MYLYQSKKRTVMDLSARKYHFIEELMTVEKESVIEALERVLKREKEAQQRISPAHKKELDKRLKSYADNPDDLLDWQGGAGIGKNVGDDFREGKLTLPVIRAIAAGDSEDRVFWTRTLEKRVIEAGDQDRALALLEQHGTLDSTRADALMWAERAKTSLTALPDHAIRGMLTDLADYVVARLV